MNIRTNIIISLATLVVSSTLMSGNAAAVSFQTCKPQTSVTGGNSAGMVAKFRQRRAERKAKRAWKNEVKKYHGSAYADLDNAWSVRMSCGLNAGGNTYCTITAVPCDKKKYK